jgi:signal transduction histidine kinase
MLKSDKHRDSVFIVDDDPGIRQTVADILVVKGYEVAVFERGAPVAVALETHIPKVALIDLKLTDMSGLELVRQIRAVSEDTECIVLTGFASQASAIEAVNLGAFGFLQKPYDVDQVLFMIRRATEKWNARTELARNNKELESRVAARTAELSIKNDQLARQSLELKRSNNELEQFAYVASHDLQAPLRTIQNFSQLFVKNYPFQKEDEALEIINFISQASGDMTRMVEDLLSYARLGQRVTVTESVSLQDQLELALDTLSPELRNQDTQIALTGEFPTVIANKLLVTNIFRNILQNASNYRRENVQLDILINGRSTEDHVVVTIADNGIGIEPENYEQIFWLFKRITGGKEHEGTGIGLASAKKSIELMGGQIWVDSVVGEGSSFHLQFLRPRDGAD